MRDILIIGLIIAVVVILFKVMFGTPLVQRVMESFTSSMINSVTECPIGSTLYMYDGAVFCCSGKIKPEANMLTETCVPTQLQDRDDMTFCGLGPAHGGVPNCLEANVKGFRDEGARVCPPSAPNYARGPPGSATAKGRCCAGPTNATRSDCMSTAGSCDVTPSGTSILKSAQPSCQLRKLMEGEGACPSSYNTSINLAQHNGGAFRSVTFPSCSNMMSNKFCIAKPVLANMKSLKWTDYDEKFRKQTTEDAWMKQIGKIYDGVPVC